MKVKLYLRFSRYLKPYLSKELCLLLLMILANVGSLASPYILKIIIDDVFPTKNFNLLVTILLVWFGINMVRLVVSFLSDYLFVWISNQIVKDIRIDLFNHLIRLPMNYFDKNKTGDIIHRVNNEVNTIQSILTSSVVRLINNIIIIIGLIVVLSLLNFKLFLLFLFVIPFVFINTIYFQPKIHKNIKESREKDADILSYLVERFENIKLIKSYNRYDYENSKLNLKISQLIDNYLRNIILSSTTRHLSLFLISFTPILIYFMGGKQVFAGSMTIGALVAFVQYLTRLFEPLRDLIGLYWDAVRATVSMQRIFELFELPIQKNDNKVITDFSLKHKDIIFQDVNFYYDGNIVLDSISMKFEAGKKYAIVGSSGCGKSTIVSLLCNFYQPLQGSILIGDNELSNFEIHELRRKIALVTQDNQLFHDTIWDNIKYGKLDCTANEIEDVALLTGVNNVVNKVKDGYSSIIGDRGAKLSGGQKQRIAIARAILKKADIIILDEATSALDAESERLIVENLCKLYDDKLMIFINHRLNNVKDVDVIMFIYKGKVVEIGNHETLINNRKYYYNMYREQID